MEYVIEAHFDMTDQASGSDNPGKFKDIITRRLRKGNVTIPLTLAVASFQLNLNYTKRKKSTVYAGEEKDLGYKLYDFDYSNPEDIQPMFFRAVLKDGVLDVRDCEVVR
ncbi:MAG: type I-E CRISPR-associated protein Cas5/CasD [Eisenbergiella sp.]